MEKTKTERRRKKRDCPRPRRPYRLTPEGLASLRSWVCRTKPWLLTSGPTTTAGKRRSSQNARKHGLRSADAERERAEGWAALRLLRLEAEEEEDNARV